MSRTPGSWVDVCIEAELDAGELLAVLDDPAVQGAWEDAGTLHLYWPEEEWNSDRLASLRGAMQRLSGGHPTDIPLLVNRLPFQDWNRQWAESVKPLRIGRLVIRPTWEEAALRADDLEIILDPKQAFGTGHHATTRMLLEWLQLDMRGGERVLDVGAGSAILAMAAVRLGARSALAVECDPVAVECAREYVGRNGLAGSIELVCGTLADLPPQPEVDYVLANLDRPTLLALAQDLAGYGEGGAVLCLSGMLPEQADEIIERFASLGLACLDRREQDGWVALKLIRPESCEGDA